MPDQPSPRRRFQFRLRTLLIGVAIFCVVVGYVGGQASIVRERRALLDSIKADGGSYEMRIYYNEANPPPPPPPWLRRILGDEAVGWLLVSPATDEETMARIHRLFPDTHIAIGRKTVHGIILESIDGASVKRD